jgi:ribosomal protein L30E
MLTQSLKALQKAIKNGNRVIIANPTIESLKNHSSKVVKTNALKLIALLK